MHKRLLIFISIAIAIALLFWYSSTLQSTFYILVGFFWDLVQYNEPLAVLLFILVAIVAALISPFTNIPLVPIAVAIWGPLLTTIYLFTGWIVGDVLAYFIGRYLGRRIVTLFMTREKLDELSHSIKERAKFIPALILRFTLPAELGYVFGIIRYDLIYYVTISLIAELPFAIVATFASDAVLNGNTLEFLGYISTLLFVIVAGYYYRYKNSTTAH